MTHALPSQIFNNLRTVDFTNLPSFNPFGLALVGSSVIGITRFNTAEAPSFTIPPHLRRGNRGNPRPFQSFFASASLFPKNKSTKNKMSRRRGFKRRRTGGLSTAKLALKEVRKMKRRQEVKRDDKALISFGTVLNTGQITSLCDIAQGSGRSDRDGNRISPISLTIRYNWLGQAASTAEVYRIIVFRDKQQILATTPAVLDVLQSAGAISLYNEDFLGRFKILYDQMWTGANDANIRLSFVGLVKIRLTLPMVFAASASTDIVKNGLYIIAITNVASNAPTYVYSTRLSYYDN